jgi:hypothetical protein
VKNRVVWFVKQGCTFASTKNKVESLHQNIEKVREFSKIKRRTGL